MRSISRRAVVAAFLSFVLAGGASAQEKAEKPGLDDVELESAVKPGESVEVEKLLQVWTTKLHQVLVADPQMRGTQIRFSESDVKLTWGAFKKLLGFNDVVIEETEANGTKLVFAHLRRNLASRVAPPFHVVPAGEALPARDEVVTLFVPIKHGAGNDIFATVRGLLVRDVNRIGNLLYVAGPDVIIIVDFASNCAYYKKVIEQLDTDGPARMTKAFALAHAPARDAVKVVSALFGAPSLRVVADEPTNRLIVRGTKEQVEDVTKLIAELDVVVPPVTLAPSIPAERLVPAPQLGLELEDEGAAASSARVTSVATDGPSSKAEVRPGDRIVAIDGEKVTSARGLVATLAKLTGDHTVLKLARGDWQREVTIAFENASKKK